MALNSKNFRYTYWLVVAFIKKNAQPIFLSFLISIIAVISIVSFSPYLFKYFSSQTKVIGIAGVHTIDNLPDQVLGEISNGLVYTNEKGVIVPLLADSWEVVNKGKEYRFHIKKDLVWNDGEPFTARDINYTFKDVKTEIQDDYLLTFKLTKPLAIFPNFLTKPVIKHPLVGVAGLYRIDKARIKAGEVKELQLSPNKPDQPVIIYKFYDTETKLINAYKLGEINEMSTTQANIADTFSSWKNTQIDKNIDYSRVMALFFNLNHPFLKEEKDIRQAIAMAIDKSVFTERGETAYSPIPPTSWAYHPPDKTISYNTDLSKKLLKNYTEGTSAAELTISTYYDHLDMADNIKENLEGVGLPARVEVLASDRPSTFDLFLAQMRLTQDPDQYFFWHSTQKQGNITNYKNVRIDKLLEDGRETTDIEQRKKIYSDFQRILADDMPAYFLYYPYNYTIRRE